MKKITLGDVLEASGFGVDREGIWTATWTRRRNQCEGLQEECSKDKGQQNQSLGWAQSLLNEQEVQRGSSRWGEVGSIITASDKNFRKASVVGFFIIEFYHNN